MLKYQIFSCSQYNKNIFADIYELCFGKKINENYVKWKYENNPAGKVIAYSAEAEEATAGFYGLIPERYKIGEKAQTVYQSMDTMTHPQFQKQGIFTTLAEKTYQTVFENDAEGFLIGIPGSNSYHGFVAKLKWRCIHHFSYVFIHKQIFKLLNPIYSEKIFSIKEISNFNSPVISDFLSKIRYAPDKIQAIIDSNFLDWRITRNLSTNYKSLGFYKNEKLSAIIIYHITEDKKCFIDWFYASDSRSESKILKCFCHFIFKTHSLKYIYSWKSLNTKTLKSFNSIGFLSNPFNNGPFSYKVPFIIHSKVETINGINLNNINNYELQPIIQD